MKNRIRLAAIAVAATVPLTVVSGGVASATNIGQEGCTPGYWKNRTSNWEEYSPSTQLGTIFTSLAGTKYATTTLLQALSLKGGSTLDGATQTLLRAAAAAVLNAAHEGVGYPYRRFGEFKIIEKVDAALASGNRATILNLATTLDQVNNLGWPLN
jgi:hypothetical protein